MVPSAPWLLPGDKAVPACTWPILFPGISIPNGAHFALTSWYHHRVIEIVLTVYGFNPYGKIWYAALSPIGIGPQLAPEMTRPTSYYFRRCLMLYNGKDFSSKKRIAMLQHLNAIPPSPTPINTGCFNMVTCRIHCCNHKNSWILFLTTKFAEAKPNKTTIQRHCCSNTASNGNCLAWHPPEGVELKGINFFRPYGRFWSTHARTWWWTVNIFIRTTKF